MNEKENLMDAKFIKNALQKNKSAKADQHISPIAGTLFSVMLLIATFGVFFGDKQ